MYIKREITKKFTKIRDVYNVIAVVGARQSGKTTFLKHEIKNIKANYLLFDDPDVRNIFEEDIKKFENQYIKSADLSVLDEVQYCSDAGRKLKYLADSNHKLWITASSEMILSKEVLSFLVGRVSIIKLFPFSIIEFLSLKGQKEFTKKILKRYIEEHIQYGGYPKVCITEDYELKKTILKDLYETMVLKDIAQTFSLDDIRSLDELARYLAINTGALLSYNNISNEINLSFQTIKKYLDAMEKSHLIARVQPYHNNKTKEIVKRPKVYFIDTGLRNIISKDQNPLLNGRLFENYIFTELQKLGLSPKYWRTKSKAEVDFIIEKDNMIIPIEVKKTADKIEKSLQSFIERYNPKKALIITLNSKNITKKFKGCKVYFTDILEIRNILM